MARFSKNLIFLSILILFFTSLSYGAYPEFEFVPLNFPAGQVDIVGKSSSGTQIELFINGLTLGTNDVIANRTLIILDGSSIQNQVLPFGSTITFRNEGPRTYQLNISGVYKELNYGDELNYVGTQIGDVMFTDYVEGVNRVISVVDTLIDFKFEYVNDYLENGNNELRFVQRYPYLFYSNESEFEYTINFEKYVNDITVTNFTNITNQHSGSIFGYVESVSYPMYYLQNINPNELGNIGALNSVALTGDKFNISLENLREGENNIYLITTDPNNQNIFTGVQRVQIFVDTIPPYLNMKKVTFEKSGTTYAIDFGSEIFINGNRLNLEIETDAVTLNYTFNNETFTKPVLNGSINLTLNLKDGINPLILEPIDIAGNKIKKSHNIYFDDKRIQILKESLKPEEMFKSGGVAHFFFQQIEGKTNKPDVKLTIFTIPVGAETLDGKEVRCDSYEELFIRNLGQLDRDRVDGPELNLNESQVSLTNFMFQKTTVSSDSDGEFKALIGLQEKDFTRKEYSDSVNNKVEEIQSVASQNRICFAMSDKYGNVNVHEERVTLDAGNTLWRPVEITTIPNTIYSAEIENDGDERSGNSGNVEVGVVARFEYIGSGTVNKITSFRVQMDPKFKADSKNMDIDTARTKYKFDPSTNEMIVYFPVKIRALGIKPIDYPDNWDLAFATRPVYTVSEIDIPIDTTNPIYFQSSINIEKPLDHTKWLTPQMIDDTLKFLEKSIEYTNMAVEWTGYASVAGVLTCTGAKFWHAYELTQAKIEAGEDKSKFQKLKEEADRTMYQICDRVACSAAPRECDQLGDNEGMIEIESDSFNSDSLTSKTLTSDDFGYPLDFQYEGAVVGRLTEVKFYGPCDYNGDGKKDDGIIVDGKAERYSDETGLSFTKEIVAQSRVDKICVPYSKGKINLNNIGNVCFSKESPKYDDLRCNFFNPENHFTGKDPSVSIISSVQCGCITDTYSHLKVFLRIQEQIKGCLEQAKVGNVKGSYCERLLSQAVCDIATNVVLPELQQNINPRESAGGDDPHNGLLDFMGNLKNSEKAFDSRYKGSIFDKAGLSTAQVINKACLAAFTGDFSVLTDSVLAGIDQNEVKPVFGPPFPESRQQGYNPLTGELSIRYMFTHGVVSGGQSIRSTYELVCDPNAPYGQYCPPGGVIISSEIPGEIFKKKTITTSKGDYASDTIIILDTKARFWYNKLRVTHEYTLKNEKVPAEVNDFLIIHKQETLLANCNWNTGIYGSALTDTENMGGISCDTIFGEDALMSSFTIDKDKTNILPSAQKKFYQGNKLYLDLGYRVQNSESFNQDVSLASLVECGSGTEKYILKDSSGRDVHINSITSEVPVSYGKSTFELLTIPEVSDGSTVEYVLGADLENLNPYDTIKLLSKDTTKLPSYNLKYVEVSNQDGSKVEILNENGGYNIVRNTADDKNMFVLVEFEGEKFKEMQRIRFYFASKPTDVDAILGKKVDDNNDIGATPTYTLIVKDPNAIPYGECKLKMRIMPTSQAIALTKDNFATYNPISGTDEEGKLLTNVETSSIVEKSFLISKTPTEIESNQIYFDLLTPYNGQSILYNSDEVKINLNSLIGTVKNNLDSNTELKLSYTIKSNKFGELGSDEIKFEKTGLDSKEITIPITSALKESLESLNTYSDLSDKVDSWVSGSQTGEEIYFSYKVEKKSIDEDGDPIKGVLIPQTQLKLLLVPKTN